MLKKKLVCYGIKLLKFFYETKDFKIIKTIKIVILLKKFTLLIFKKN